MRVLVGCEFSQVVAQAFRERGHDAYSCDILPTEGNPDWHICGDVLDIIDDDWDIGIFHPPCTFLANSGVQHLYRDYTRWCKLADARKFFLSLYNSEIPKVCIENPVPHCFADLPRYTQIIQPYQFGHEIQKRTCLWLRGLNPLKPTNVVGKGENYFDKNGNSNGSKWYQLAPSVDRWKYRSRTFEGIAAAMADQWGYYD